MSHRPLDGFRVVDLSEVMQAPFATQMLADFGAEVIKVERPERGDVMRSMDREAVAQGLVSSHFAALNRHKRSICLDLKDTEDVQKLLTLVAEADVLVNNYRPGVMARLGLGYDHVSTINPRLIYATAYGFGPTGPLAAKAGQDLVAQSITGISMQRPSEGHDPYLHPIPFIDYAGGMSLAQGITLALMERERSGLGQEVSISLFDTGLAIQTLEASARLMYSRPINWVADHFPNQPFAVKDGWIAVVGFFRENPLRLICEALEIGDLSQRPEYSTAELQAQRRDDLNALLAEEFASRSLDECVASLEASDILCAPILSLAEALKHPQVVANRLISEVSAPGQQGLQTIANPIRLSRTPASSSGKVPGLGEHTEEVLDPKNAARGQNN